MLDENSILNELESVQTKEELEDFHQKYLGKKGLISQELKSLGSLSPEEKKEKGQKLGNLKNNVDSKYKEKQEYFKKQEIDEKLQNDIIDITTPGIKQEKGHYSLIAETRREAEDIFKGMGFTIEYGNDLVTKYENFNTLNIPSSHPATEMHDTLYMNEEDSGGENLLLRTHTSAMQNKLIKKHGVPLSLMIPGKVYRYENTDASHDSIFDQLEGIVIDENISISHAKNTITNFLKRIFKADIEIQMRPAYFPFVEPGFEIDASCPICKKEGCSLCKNTGWIEILGAGMIHPNVLKEAGVDTSKYTGFAFGMGLARMIAIRYGIKDIRLFTNGDLRFTQSS